MSQAEPLPREQPHIHVTRSRQRDMNADKCPCFILGADSVCSLSACFQADSGLCSVQVFQAVVLKSLGKNLITPKVTFDTTESASFVFRPRS